MDIRPSPIAGQWYNGNPVELADEIDGYVGNAKLPVLAGNILGIVVPHAGHRYSGPVAGYGFASIKDEKPDIVVIVSPMHHPYWENFLVTSHEAYATPLGTLPVDRELVDETSRYLVEGGAAPLTGVSYDAEHSLEIELPFIQQIYSHSFRFLPIMIKSLAQSESRALGIALSKLLLDKKCVLIASTDLSHFYSQSIAEKLDGNMLQAITALSSDRMYDLERNERGFACGLGAVSAVVECCTLLGANKAVLLKQATSGDVTGDFSSVVGYGAVAILAKS